MPTVTLPDGSTRSYDAPVTAAQIAADIGPGLAKAAMLAVVAEMTPASVKTMASVKTKKTDALARGH